MGSSTCRNTPLVEVGVLMARRGRKRRLEIETRYWERNSSSPTWGQRAAAWARNRRPREILVDSGRVAMTDIVPDLDPGRA